MPYEKTGILHELLLSSYTEVNDVVVDLLNR
jgi:hypothetical protein